MKYYNVDVLPTGETMMVVMRLVMTDGSNDVDNGEESMYTFVFSVRRNGRRTVNLMKGFHSQGVHAL